MRIRVGVGLPTAIRGADHGALLDWARRAEAGPFTSLGVVDRIPYDSLEPMAALGAAAAVTERIGLVTMVVIGPLRNAVVLAKQAATIQAISRGRLVLGLGIGARGEDYEVAGVPTAGRADRLAGQIRAIRSAWDDERVGPALAAPPPLLAGGTSDRAVARVALHADGYVHGGGPPRSFARVVEKVRTAWRDAGRPGGPRLWAQGYFAVGEDARERGLESMRDYYAFTGPFAEKIAEGLLTTPQAVAAFLRGYEELGCQEMVLLPAVADLEQLERLEDVLASLP
jgi:alkanesulfonate monooxygenase SsuD/methylene tetrahydromethanopterin reductase-like flavin-dependent oxidoreductase (luciferase family)